MRSARRRNGGRGSARRGGGGAPAWAPSAATLTNLRGWYRADLGVTLVGADVDAWADQSGVGNHLTVAAAGNRPLYVATGFNGGAQPYVEFGVAAATEYLRKVVFSWGGTAGPYTIALVMKVLTIGASSDRLFTYSAASQRPAVDLGTGVGRCYTAVAGPTLGGVTNLTTAYRSYLYWCDGTDAKIYVNNVQDATVAIAPGTFAADGAQFSLASSAGAFYCNLQLAELVVMRSAMTTAERLAYDTYVSTRYGV